MVHAFPLGLALIIMLPIFGCLMLNCLKQWLDSKPNGNKEDEEKIIKYTIVLMVIMFIMKCIG